MQNELKYDNSPRNVILEESSTQGFFGMPLVTYLVTPKVPTWWLLKGEKNLKLCLSRVLENAFPKMLSIVFCDGERLRKIKCLITIPWRALYFLPNHCLEICLYVCLYVT